MSDLRRYMILLVAVAITAVALSLTLGVPYIFTVTGFAGWAFVGHLVTADDDAPGGWSNPDGELAFPRMSLVVKGVVLVGLFVAMEAFPALIDFGARR